VRFPHLLYSLHTYLLLDSPSPLLSTKTTILLQISVPTPCPVPIPALGHLGVLQRIDKVIVDMAVYPVAVHPRTVVVHRNKSTCPADEVRLAESAMMPMHPTCPHHSHCGGSNLPRMCHHGVPKIANALALLIMEGDQAWLRALLELATARAPRIPIRQLPVP
jgi:hypothetical protein